jgi:hypothetical protein
MKYTELLQFKVSPDAKAALLQASAARGIKLSEYLRSAIALSIAMDAALDAPTAQETPRADH